MSLNDVLGGFPVQLFVTLAGVTLLFTQAQLAGPRPWRAAVRLCRATRAYSGDVLRVGGVIATLGPESATASMMAMACRSRARWHSTIGCHHGRQRRGACRRPGNVIVTGIMTKIGLGMELRTRGQLSGARVRRVPGYLFSAAGSSSAPATTGWTRPLRATRR
jgi:hypothetical protein